MMMVTQLRETNLVSYAFRVHKSCQDIGKFKMKKINILQRMIFLKQEISLLMNDKGYIKIVDRKKDMIISSGYNVYPNELEDYLATHPDILEAGVIGVDDKNRGEYIKAFVVTKNKNLSSSDIISFCKKGLTEYKVPKRIVFIEDLPKTNVGKILRRELRKIT